MTLAAVSSSSTTGMANQAVLNVPTQTVSPDQFLKLLITQLANQDPLNPMDQQQFIGELAQMQSVSEMRQMNTALTAEGQTQQRAAALGMLGRTVQWQDAQGLSQSGKVDAVIVVGDSQVAVKVGKAEVNVGDVQQVLAGS